MNSDTCTAIQGWQPHCDDLVSVQPWPWQPGSITLCSPSVHTHPHISEYSQVIYTAWGMYKEGCLVRTACAKAKTSIHNTAASSVSLCGAVIVHSRWLWMKIEHVVLSLCQVPWGPGQDGPSWRNWSNVPQISLLCTGLPVNRSATHNSLRVIHYHKFCEPLASSYGLAFQAGNI